MERQGKQQTAEALLARADVQAFIRHYVVELANGNAAVFAGAGLSVGAGFVNWQDLLRGIAQELNLVVERTNLIALAQYHVNERSSRNGLTRKILEEFSDEHELTPSHHLLASLPIRTYWTTNYDHLIEQALKQQNKTVESKKRVGDLLKPVERYDAIVYKMHGDVTEPENAILTKDDYDSYFRKHAAFVNQLKADFVSKTFLFLGFSFSDPNIDYVLSRLRVVLDGATRTHYCVLGSVTKRPRESAVDFRHRCQEQTYLIKDLARLGVKVLLVEDFAHIPVLLQLVERQFRARSIFVSGSAERFLEEWHPAFIADLGRRLIEERLTLITGFGLGVGPNIIAGAYETILARPHRFGLSQLNAMPFPVGAIPQKERDRRFSAQREIMLRQAGLAIFLCGNKRQGKRVVAASGMRDEFRIALRYGVLPIPVGATGGVALELWEQVNVEFDNFYPNATPQTRRAFKMLKSGTTSGQLIGAVVHLIKAHTSTGAAAQIKGRS